LGVGGADTYTFFGILIICSWICIFFFNFGILEFGILEFGILEFWNLEFGIWNLEFGILVTVSWGR
jgi:hypothetical protein